MDTNNNPTHTQDLQQDGNQTYVDQSQAIIWPTHVPLSYTGSDGPITVFVPVIPPNEKSEGQTPWFTIPGSDQKFPAEYNQTGCEFTSPIVEPESATSEPVSPTMKAGSLVTPMYSQPAQAVTVVQLMHVTQHAERRLTNMSLPPPLTDSEVFIGNIPRWITVEDLYSVFAKIGQVYQARIKTNFSGQSKGYGFIRFYDEGDARRAMTELRGYKFYPSVQKGLCVFKSINNTRLFLHNIPKYLDAKDIYELAVRHPKILGLVNVECPINIARTCNCKRNRGYCFMEFATHMNAMLSLKAMLRNPTMFFSGWSINVEWANSKGN